MRKAMMFQKIVVNTWGGVNDMLYLVKEGRYDAACDVHCMEGWASSVNLSVNLSVRDSSVGI